MINDFQKCALCVCIGASRLDDLFPQIRQALQWADLIEIRLDKLIKLDPNEIAELAKRIPCPVIWTLRKASHGGSFHGSEEERLAVLSPLMQKIRPAFFDLEADTPQPIIQSLQNLSPRTQWIISWHDLSGTPADLEEIYQKISLLPAAFYKIATLARSSTDSLRMLNFSRKLNRKGKKFFGVCMGDLGQPTRILAPLTGQTMTYAALETGKETAPGQLTAQELVCTYRFRELNKESDIFGLIGNPVAGSSSQLTHNAVLRELGRNGVYVKFCLMPDEFSQFFQEIAALPVRGLSVTMPFKETVLPLLEDPHRLSACNTLLRTSNGWQGFNTDGMGAMKALGLPSLKDQKMVILGAGGTAKAIASAAHKEGALVAILNRTSDKAQKIAAPIKARWGSLKELPSLIEEGYHCLIQATSVGMAPAAEEMPVLPDWIPKNIRALDVISHPPQTRLLREVKRQGGEAISGRELFIHQAVEQFVLWFGPNTSRSVVEKTLRLHLPKVNNQPSVKVHQSGLSGSLSLPPSKSHTIRAILLAAFARGTSYLHGLLDSPDTERAIQAARQFGAVVSSTEKGVSIQGVAGYPRTPSDVINAGNSGQVLRFAGALAAHAEGSTVITGDASLRSQRPVQPLLKGLAGLGVLAESTRGNGFAPFVVKGPLQPGTTELDGKDSQPVSALLMAAAFAEGTSEIRVRNAGEKPWIALTLSWLDRIGVQYHQRNFEYFSIQGKRMRPAFEAAIPGDLSSLAFPLAAALVTNSELLIQNVDMSDIQGDKAVVYLLKKMGAQLEIDSACQSLRILPNGRLKGQVIDANDFIDAVPILAVLGCFAEGETEIVNAGIARQKESNRLAGIVAELKKMGAQIEETEEGLKVRSSKLKGSAVDSHEDHRLALSLIVAGLGAEGETQVRGTACIAKSYPTFFEDFKKIGALIEHG